MAEPVDAADLKSVSRRECGFESHRPHHLRLATSPIDVPMGGFGERVGRSPFCRKAKGERHFVREDIDFGMAAYVGILACLALALAPGARGVWAAPLIPEANAEPRLAREASRKHALDGREGPSPNDSPARWPAVTTDHPL